MNTNFSSHTANPSATGMPDLATAGDPSRPLSVLVGHMTESVIRCAEAVQRIGIENQLKSQRLKQNSFCGPVLKPSSSEAPFINATLPHNAAGAGIGSRPANVLQVDGSSGGEKLIKIHWGRYHAERAEQLRRVVNEYEESAEMLARVGDHDLADFCRIRAAENAVWMEEEWAMALAAA
jgi:hypothetical protein